jgi:hypothetical protein
MLAKNMLMAAALGLSIVDKTHPDWVQRLTFDDISGSTVNDSSSSNNDGTIVGGVSFSAGQVGDEAVFNGTTGEIDLGSMALGNDFGFMLWVKAPTPTSAQRPAATLAWGSTVSERIGIITLSSLSATNFMVNGGTDATWRDTGAPADGSTRSQIIVNVTASGYKLYKDNVLQQDISTTLSVPAVTHFLGRFGNTTAFHYDGAVDEWGILNRPFTIAEIALMWNGGAGVG